MAGFPHIYIYIYTCERAEPGRRKSRLERFTAVLTHAVFLLAAGAQRQGTHWGGPSGPLWGKGALRAPLGGGGPFGPPLGGLSQGVRSLGSDWRDHFPLLNKLKWGLEVISLEKNSLK